MKLHVRKTILGAFILIGLIFASTLIYMIHLSAPLGVVLPFVVLLIFWIICIKKISLDAYVEITEQELKVSTPQLFRIAAYRNFLLTHYQFSLNDIQSVTLVHEDENGSCLKIGTRNGHESIVPVDAFNKDEISVLIKKLSQ